MKRQNDGKDEINALQNQFTAYLLVAVRRQKFAYIDKQNKLNGRELSVDYQLVQFADNSIESNQCMGYTDTADGGYCTDAGAGAPYCAGTLHSI